MHKFLRYGFFCISSLSLYDCNAMLETLKTVEVVALAADPAIRAAKPIVKEVGRLFGHHKRHRNEQQIVVQEPVQQKVVDDSKGFWATTQSKLVEQGSEALADGIVKGVTYLTVAAYNKLTTQSPAPQPLIMPAPQLAPQAIVIKIRSHHRQHRRRYSYSSSQESSLSSSQSSSESESSSDSDYEYRHRHQHKSRLHRYRHHR